MNIGYPPVSPPVNQSFDSVLQFDKLTMCFNDPDEENVKGTYGLVLSDKIEKSIPGLFVTKGRRYKLVCRIPVPFTDSINKEHIHFEVGPRQLGLPSYRWEFNPSKVSADGMNDALAFFDSCVDAHHTEFFRGAVVTRCDIAVDLPGQNLDSRIVRTTRLQKHGVYSNRHGEPETVYLGTPRSRRIVAYDKPIPGSMLTRLRLEVRLKPRCFGYQLASLENPFAKVQLIPADFSHSATLTIPPQLIADSIRIGGLKRAMSALPSSKDRAALKAAYTAAVSVLPSSEGLWASWSDTLIACGLGQHLGATSNVDLANAA